MILVTGATGLVGSAVTRLLAAHGVPLRLMVREPAQAAPVAGADMVAGDFADPASLDRALAGVDRAFLLTPVGAQQAEWEANFVDAAARAAVSVIVKHSAVGADAGAEGVGSAHGVSERYLLESGLAAVIVRPVMFMENLLRWAPPIRQAAALVVPLTDRTVRINMISVQDVAAVEAAALSQPHHAGETYTLTGPDLMTFADVAAGVSEGVGTSVPLLVVDAAEYRERCTAAGVPDAEVEGQIDYFSTLTAATTSLTVVTQDVQHVLGRPAASLRAFAVDHADELGPPGADHGDVSGTDSRAPSRFGRTQTRM